MNVSWITRMDACDICIEPMTTDHLHQLESGTWVCFKCLIKKYTTSSPRNLPSKESRWKGVRPSINSMITKAFR
jgi:hypothetical protein